MAKSAIRSALLCAALVVPAWVVTGCSGGENGDGGSSGTGGLTGTGGSAGSAGTPGGGGSGGGQELTLAQQVVGAWGASGNCDGSAVTVGQFICPGGRVRGVETFDGFEFLVCGTWSAEEPSSVNSNVQLIAVIDPNDPANEDVIAQQYAYDGESDILTLQIACNIPLQRLEGGVDASDCESVACTNGGGSGPISCGTDCDCGRCWYCESGTCRYGGEGEFGCFRGCGEFIP